MQDGVNRPGPGTKLPWLRAVAMMTRLEWMGAELHTWRRWVALAVLPLTYLGLLGVGLSSAFGGASYLRFVVPGAIVMQALSGLNRVVARTVTERRWGLAAFKLQSGVPQSAYLLGILFPGVIVFAAQALVLLALAVALGVRYSVLSSIAMVAVAILCVLTWECLSFVVAAAIRNYQTRDFVLAVAVMPLTFAAPVFYTLDNAPTALRLLARVNPLTYQAELVRGVAQGAFALSAALICLLVLTASMFLALRAVRVMRELSFEG